MKLLRYLLLFPSIAFAQVQFDPSQIPSNITVSAGSVDNSTITLKDGASPTVTGRIEHDSGSDTLKVGNGVGTETYKPITNIADTEIMIGTGPGASGFAPLSGDATMSNGGVVTIDHTNIDNIGTNTHAQIDTHIADTTNPHAVTADDILDDIAACALAGKNNVHIEDSVVSCDPISTDTVDVDLPSWRGPANMTLTIGGAASPVGVITPASVGSTYCDETNDNCWIAVGTTNTDWEEIAGVTAEFIEDAAGQMGDGVENGTTLTYNDGNGNWDVRTTESFVVAISDYTTALTTGDKWAMQMPYAFTLTDARAGCDTAPTTDNVIFDVLYHATEPASPVTIMTTNKLEIEATQTSTDDATTQPTLTTTVLADGSWLIFNINNLDTGATAAGCSISLIGYQT